MKNIISISITAVILFFSIAIQAQHCDGANRGNAFNIIQLLQKHVEISEEQTAAIKEILTEQKSKISELKSNFQEGDSRADMRAAVQQLKADADASITGVLNAEQVVLYQELKTNLRGKGGKNFDRGGSCGAKGKANSAEMKVKFLSMRVELDEEISRKDKKKIKALRKTMKAAKAEKKAFFEEWKSKDEMPSKEEMKAAMANLNDKYKKEWAAVDALVEKYDAEIKTIFEKNEISRLGKGACGDKGWGKGKKGAKGSCEGYDKETCCTSEATTPKCCKGEMGKKGKMKARFLLMNPNGSGEDVSKVEPIEVEISTVQINPNPAKTNATIDYQVKNEGNIKIDLVDESGNFVRNLLNEYKTEGTYQLKLNTSTLKSKLYFIAIRDAAGVNNKKLLIN